MRKALNNPWVVGSLSLTALGAVYSNVMVPDMETLIRPPRAPVPSVEDARPSAGPVAGLPLPGVGGSVQQPLKAQIDQMGWPDQIRRDPFKLVSLAIPSEETDDDFDGNDEKGDEDFLSSAQEPNRRGPALELQAVALGEEGKIAVINRIMVQEGEMIGEYLVVHIRSDAVVLAGPEGLEWLEFLEKRRVSEESEESDESEES